MTPTPQPFDLKAAPMHIGRVGLKVRDLARISAFYENVIGLTRVGGEGASISLGAAGKPLLDLEGDPSLTPRNPREAGLFHTAFLLPSRGDLARWLAFVIENRISLQGASDHLVSEAIYLADPEGNGIEVYADRPPSAWRDSLGQIQMATDPLDAHDLLRQTGGKSWEKFPGAGVIGHVHLQVGSTAQADAFYRDILGFDVAAEYPGASFFGSGGYHHQLAGNIWNSRNAGRRSDGMAGLSEVEIIVSQEALAQIHARAAAAGIALRETGGGARLADPWGTKILLSH
jgi:catechol 2,3-dioxygenase